jgi:hypothetical protein
MTMKNVVFWDIKTQFVLHRRHITSTLESHIRAGWRLTSFVSVAMLTAPKFDFEPIKPH